MNKRNKATYLHFGQHTYTSAQKQYNLFTREIIKKPNRDKSNWMEQQCKEAEDASTMNRMQDVRKTVKLLNGDFELKIAQIKDADGKVQ